MPDHQITELASNLFKLRQSVSYALMEVRLLHVPISMMPWNCNFWGTFLYSKNHMISTMGKSLSYGQKQKAKDPPSFIIKGNTELPTLMIIHTIGISSVECVFFCPIKDIKRILASNALYLLTLISVQKFRKIGKCVIYRNKMMCNYSEIMLKHIVITRH